MSEKTLLDKLAGIIVANNKVLLQAVDEKIRASEQRVTTKLTKKIEDSQKDTIEVLSDMIETGYNMHEKRIRHIEHKLGIASPKAQ